METAWNLSLNHAIHTFATFTTPNHCEHRFGVGVGIRASRPGNDEGVLLASSGVIFT
jgi:hypothetical protein